MPKRKPIAAPAPAKGFKRVVPKEQPFWSPDDEDAEHPNPLTAIFLGTRKLPAKGKFKEQTVHDCEESGTGALYTVAERGNLPWLFRAAQLGVGQVFQVRWLEKADPTESAPNGVNLFTLDVEA